MLPSDVNAKQQSSTAEVLKEEKDPAVSSHSREQETKRRAPRNLFLLGGGRSGEVCVWKGAGKRSLLLTGRAVICLIRDEEKARACVVGKCGGWRDVLK